MILRQYSFARRCMSTCTCATQHQLYFLSQFQENLGKTREFFQILLHALED